jgi:hypothetical protein
MHARVAVCRNVTCTIRVPVEIRLVSTLTSEDEDRVADALAGVLADLLEGLPIAYVMRIATTSNKVFERSNLESPRPTLID